MQLRTPVCSGRVVASLALTFGIVTAVHPNSAVMAQDWPSRTVTVVVPFGPGNALETIGRPVLDGLSKRLGKPFVVENRAGAGSATGAAYAARAVPDGHTILFHSSTLSILHSVQPRRTYDTLNDFIPVVPLGAQPTLLITSTSKGIKSARELIAAAKARPGAMNFASAGPGSTSHVAAERFRLPAGIDAKHVPFRAPSDALTETITGRIDFYFPPISVALPLVRDGKLAALAVSTKARAAALPDVPTTTELGLKDSAFEFWTGFLLPAKTPRDIVLKLNAETRSVLETPTIQARLKSFGYAPMNMTPEEFAKFFRDDIDDLAKSIKAAGIKAN